MSLGVGTIGTSKTIGELARELRVNPHYLKGIAEGMGLEMERVGRFRVLPPRELERLRRRLAQVRPARAVTAAD